MRHLRSLCWVLFTLSFATAAYGAKPAAAGDWNAKSSLPSLLVPRKPDPDSIYRAAPPPTPGESFATDEEAEKAAREVLLKHFGKPSATLEVARAVKEKGIYMVRFRGLFHGILIHAGGAEVTFAGKTPSGAWQLITDFKVQPKSEKKVVSRDVARAALEAYITQKSRMALTADEKARLEGLRLVYTFSPDNLKAAGDRKDDVYSLVWGTEHGPLTVDAYSGTVTTQGK